MIESVWQKLEAALTDATEIDVASVDCSIEKAVCEGTNNNLQMSKFLLNCTEHINFGHHASKSPIIFTF